MYNKSVYILTFILLAFAFCIFFAIGISAVRDVDHIFDADRMMQFDKDTRFENGITNGGIITPGTGTYSTFVGIKFDKTVYRGENCVKVELLDGQTTGFFDFNYYQWNADAKKPALDCSRYRYLKLRYSYGDNAANVSTMKFWASKETKLGQTIGSAEKSFVIANNVDGWAEAVVRIDELVFADGTSWLENKLRQFRIYMFEGNTDPDAICYVAGFGFFETEEEAYGYDFKTEKNRPIVIYDANGGVGAPTMQVKEKGKALKLSDNVPGRYGYKFMGWSTSPTGSVRYKPGGYYRGDDGERLYAVWESDTNAPVGDHIFDADRMMQFDEGTHFRNGFINGSMRSPLYGLYSAWQGVGFMKTIHNGESAVKVKLLDGYTDGFLDFNYYAYDDAEGYQPSLFGGKFPYLKIRYAYEGVTDMYYVKFFASKATPVLGKVSNGEKSFRIQDGNGEWNEVVIDLRGFKFGDETIWEDSIIRQFRINLFLANKNPYAVCYIAGMGFFETEEQAKSYDFATGTFLSTPSDVEETSEIITEQLTEEVAEAVESESNTEPQALSAPETDAAVSAETQDGMFAELVKGNQIAVGILFGCIIGVIIAIFVVAVVVNVSVRKRY